MTTSPSEATLVAVRIVAAREGRKLRNTDAEKAAQLVSEGKSPLEAIEAVMKARREALPGRRQP